MNIFQGQKFTCTHCDRLFIIKHAVYIPITLQRDGRQMFTCPVCKMKSLIVYDNHDTGIAAIRYYGIADSLFFGKTALEYLKANVDDLIKVYPNLGFKLEVNKPKLKWYATLRIIDNKVPRAGTQICSFNFAQHMLSEVNKLQSVRDIIQQLIQDIDVYLYLRQISTEAEMKKDTQFNKPESEANFKDLIHGEENPT